MQSAVHSPYASSVPPGYSHHMPPPSSVSMQQQQQQQQIQQQGKGSGTPNRADYGSYSPYPPQHALPGQSPSSSVPHSPLPPGTPVTAAIPAAATQQRMRPPAPAYDPRMANQPQHPSHQQQQHQQQQPHPQQYAAAGSHHAGSDGTASHSAPQPVSGSSGGSGSGVSASMALMANIYDDLIHELVLDTCYGVHKQEKTQSFTSRVGFDGGDVDACGQPVKPGKNADVSFKCEICSRSVGSGKFASHLEKCMGKGRNASRSARRKPVDYTPNGLSEQSGMGRQYSGGSNSNGHSIARSGTPPVNMPPQAAVGGSGGGGQRYSQPPGGSGGGNYYQQTPNPPPPVNVMSPPMQYRHGDSDGWMQQQQQHGQMKGAQPYPHNSAYPPQPVSTNMAHYPQMSHGPPIDYSSLPALPSPTLPTSSSAKRRLSPPPLDASPTAKRLAAAGANRGRPSTASSAQPAASSPTSASSDWWTDPLPSLVPHHVSTGGYPHLIYVNSPGFPLHATAPNSSQVAALLLAICGCVVGGVDEGKMCCNRREGCGSHSEDERLDVRRKVERGEMEVRVRRIKPKAGKDNGRSK